MTQDLGIPPPARDRWRHREEQLLHISPEAVEHSLRGFPLGIVQHRSLDWLARGLRRAMSFGIAPPRHAPARLGNAAIRRELEQLAELAEALWRKLLDCDESTESRLWDHAFQLWPGQNAIAAAMDPQFPYVRFRHSVDEVAWLAEYLRQAAKETKSQPKNWRRAEQKELKILRATCLAPIYEDAFGQAISVNGWPSDARHSHPTPFMDFYMRIMLLAFNDRDTSNLALVLKEARRQHKADPATWLLPPE